MKDELRTGKLLVNVTIALDDLHVAGALALGLDGRSALKAHFEQAVAEAGDELQMAGRRARLEALETERRKLVMGLEEGGEQ